MKIKISKYQLLNQKSFENVRPRDLPNEITVDIDVDDMWMYNSKDIEALSYALGVQVQQEMHPDATDELKI